MKKVLILGASGNIAKYVAAELAGKVDLTQFVRDAKKLDQPVGRVVVGDVLDPTTLSAAMQGQDVVYANLGPTRMATMANSVTAAAEKSQVKRLIWVATFGIYEEEPAEELALIKSQGGDIHDANSYLGDERLGADIIDQSSVDSTIIRPNILTDGPLAEVVVTGRHEQLVGHDVSRRTVAHFISQTVLNSENYQNDSVALSNRE